MTIYDDLLVADFSECFEQMRHYEETFVKRRDFGFGGIVAVIGAVAVLIEHFKATPFILVFSGLLLVVSSIAGVLLLWSLARNRVYFAFVARYVNEIRGFYIKKHPEGFANKSGIYSDYRLPRIFNPGSSHSIDLYFFALCVSLLASGAITSFDLSWRVWVGVGPHIGWAMAVIAFLSSFVIQVLAVIVYWYRAEQSKSADGAVHRRTEPNSE